MHAAMETPSHQRDPSLRRLIVQAGVAAGVAIVIVTEALSAFHALRRGPVAFAWVVLVAVAVVAIRRNKHLFVRPQLSRAEWALVGGMVVVVGIVGLVA